MVDGVRAAYLARAGLALLLAVLVTVGCADAEFVSQPTLGPEYTVATPPASVSTPENTAQADRSPVPEPTAPANPAIGAIAPDFRLLDLNGTEVALRDFRGQVVLLNFWATWCPPCRLEIPMFVEVYEELKDQGFVIVAVNMRESREKVAAFASEYEMSFPILLDPRVEVGARYLANSIPRNIVIDRDGVVRHIIMGMMRETQLVNAVQELL